MSWLTEATLLERVNGVQKAMDCYNFCMAVSILNETVNHFNTAMFKNIDANVEGYVAKYVFYAMINIIMKRYTTAKAYVKLAHTALLLPKDI